MSIHSFASGSGLNQLSGQMRTYYRRLFIRELQPRLLFNLFGVADTVPLREGRTISWSTMAALEEGELLAEGSDGSEGSLSTGAITATLADYGKYHRFSSHVELNTVDPVLQTLFRRLAVRAARDLDKATRDVLCAHTNIIRPNDRATDGAVVAGDVLDTESIEQCEAGFDETDQVPITSMLSANPGSATLPGDPAYVALAHAHTISDLRKNSDFVKVSKYATDNQVLPGEAGMLGNTRFLNCGSAGKVEADAGSSNVDLYSTVVLAAEAFGVVDLAQRPVQTFVVPASQASHANPLGRRGSVGYTMEHAAAILQSAGVTVIRHSSSFGANT